MTSEQGQAAPPTGAAEPAVHGGKRTRRRSRRRWAVRTGVLLLLIGCLHFVGLDGKFYYPNDEVYSQPEDFGLQYEDVTFPTPDGLVLHGWLLKAVGPPRGFVVHFHGNAANVTAHVGLMDWLPPLGYHVLMFDYRGYGRSTGRVTRAGTVRDGHAALDYALTRPEARDGPLFLYGQSLGGAVALVVAADRPEVRAVVAESPFSSYRRIAALHTRRLVGFDRLARWLASLCISAGHDPLDAVGRLSPRPLLVLAAGRDRICFPELARELYDAAGEPKSFWLVPEAEHLDMTTTDRHELSRRVTEFFSSASPPEPGPASR